MFFPQRADFRVLRDSLQDKEAAWFQAADGYVDWFGVGDGCG